MALIIFMVSFLLICHAYFGYPLTLFLLNCVFGRTVKRSSIFPPLTVIIPVHNEEESIENKLINTLSLRYPKEKLQIMVVSDGSTDHTEEVVERYKHKGIQLISIREHHGKSYAESYALERAIGEIIVLTDADTYEDEDVLEKTASNFADPSIGCVSGEDRLILSGRCIHSGEYYYVSYEMLLRRLESKVSSIVCASGQFYAIRHTLKKDFCIDTRTDGEFKAVLVAVKNGLRSISDPSALFYYRETLNKKDDYNRKIRTAVRGISNIFFNPELFNPFRYGLFSYQCMCHKLLRWLVPFLQLAAFFANSALAASSANFFWLLIIQLSFYALGIFGWLNKKACVAFPVKIATYFIESNMMILIAWWRYLKGERMTIWTPAR